MGVEQKIKTASVAEIRPRRPRAGADRALAYLRVPVVQRDDSASYAVRREVRLADRAATRQHKSAQYADNTGPAMNHGKGKLQRRSAAANYPIRMSCTRAPAGYEAAGIQVIHLVDE